MIEFRMSVEGITGLLQGKIFQFNEDVRIHPPQDGIFITHTELAEIIADRTNMTERLLKLLEIETKKKTTVQSPSKEE